MTGQAEHINILGLHIDGDVTCGLDSIGVERHTGLFTHSADFSDGQHRADLVVGVHTGHKAGILTDRILYLLGGDVVAVRYIQKGNFKALFFQNIQGVQHSVMFKCGGNDVLFAFFRAIEGSGTNGLVVGLTAARGEVDFSCLTA